MNVEKGRATNAGMSFDELDRRDARRLALKALWHGASIESSWGRGIASLGGAAARCIEGAERT